jgi:hypothetical protein
MPNGFEIISEENWREADIDTRSDWNYRAMVKILKKLETIDLSIAVCPGRKYRPIVDKLIVFVGSVATTAAFWFVVLKADLLEVVTKAGK